MTAVHHSWKPVLVVTAAALLLACADAAAPVAPSPGAALAANTEGPLAVESVIGLEPLIGAMVPTSTARDINDLGLAVGWSSAPSGQRHAVLWDVNASVFPADLATLPGGTDSRANAINSTGTVIVGLSENGNLETRATRWVNVNGIWIIQDLGAFQGQTYAEALDVADDGTIIGTWTAQPGTGVRVFIWQNGVLTDLHPSVIERARGVNNSGQVVGANLNNHAVVWTATTGAVEIGTLGGNASLASDINSSGEITGTALTPSGLQRAFLWTPRKGMLDLGTLTGAVTSEGNAINSAGQVVGAALNSSSDRRAFLWSKGKMLDLGMLPGHTQSGAEAINNEKQVVGWSLGAGLDRGTLWTIK